MALSCVAAACADIADIDALQQAIKFAEHKQLPIRILGEGSNVILPEVLHALVLRPVGLGIRITQKAEHVIVQVKAGEPWHDLVKHLSALGIYGLENLALIPGLAGASVIQNIGAYGVEIADFVDTVSVFDLQKKQSLSLSARQCQFAYRDSLFKQTAGRYWVNSINLLIPKNKPLNIRYPALQQYFDEQGIHEPSATQLLNAVIHIRQSKLPDPSLLANSGSFFKNPIIAQEQVEHLLIQYPTMPYYPQTPNTAKLAAAWLIDQCGWKGKSLGPVAMHKQQALVMVNQGGATINDVLGLQNAVSLSVQKKFNVALEREPVLF